MMIATAMLQNMKVPELLGLMGVPGQLMSRVNKYLGDFISDLCVAGKHNENFVYKAFKSHWADILIVEHLKNHMAFSCFIMSHFK